VSAPASRLRRRVLEEMDRLRIMVDLSARPRTRSLGRDPGGEISRDRLALSVRAACQRPGNMTDSLIKALAPTSGRVRETSSPVPRRGAITSGGLEVPLPEMKTMNRSSSQRFLRTNSCSRLPGAHRRSPRHIVNAPARHACLGSDFDGHPPIPTGMDTRPAAVAHRRACGGAAIRPTTRRILRRHLLLVPGGERARRGRVVLRRALSASRAAYRRPPTGGRRGSCLAGIPGSDSENCPRSWRTCALKNSGAPCLLLEERRSAVGVEPAAPRVVPDAAEIPPDEIARTTGSSTWIAPGVAPTAAPMFPP